VTEVLGGGGRERPVKQRAKNRAGSIYNRPLPPPPPTTGPVGRNSGLPGWVRSKSGSVGSSQVEIRECRAGSGRNPGVLGRVRSKSGSAGPGQVEIQECRAESVCNRPLPPPPPTSGPVGLNAGPHHRQTGCIMHWVHTSSYSCYNCIKWLNDLYCSRLCLGFNNCRF
jgi:hypothetical protein